MTPPPSDALPHSLHCAGPSELSCNRRTLMIGLVTSRSATTRTDSKGIVQLPLLRTNRLITHPS
jgi:hypothetical protein